MERFRHDICLKYWLVDNKRSHDPDRGHIPELYIKSEFEPPKASRERSTRPRTNLSKVQQNTLKFLCNNDKFVVLATDKNLGPAIIEKGEYICKALKDHLSEANTYYHQPTDAEATTIQEANEKNGPQNDFFFVESLKDV
eukprot:scaffold41756_cov84-Attheya_sp.AAC.1